MAVCPVSEALALNDQLLRLVIWSEKRSFLIRFDPASLCFPPLLPSSPCLFQLCKSPSFLNLTRHCTSETISLLPCFPTSALLYITLVLGKSYLVCKFNSSANEIDVLWVFISNYHSTPKFVWRIYNLRDKLFWQSAPPAVLIPSTAATDFRKVLNMSSVMHTAPRDSLSVRVVFSNCGRFPGGSWQFGTEHRCVTART